ncbi:SH3 domain-containing protein [Pedobacter aquatilis]|uniref:SH3 domain-containing protein n=1 Tax=Pedobacter aquatilis TaxID=351343 RepID=UPI0025B4F7FF|nr:SH3 domain-containing protein [Pedobacter aquatilis]MDN3587995.1 SH3 domain-containing protein [Pedobacter aquatilis]
MSKTLFSFFAFVLLSVQLFAQETYRVTADELRVRAASDQKSKVIGSIPQNETVSVVDASNDKFFKVKFKKGEGWVSKDFLEKVATQTANPQVNAQQPIEPVQNTKATVSGVEDMYRVTTDNLRVREKADPKSKVIGYLPENENVAVIDSTNTSYFKIKVTNGEGYVSKEFLVRISPVKKADAPVVAPSIPETNQDNSKIIFLVVVAVLLITILFFIFKYAKGNKVFILIVSLIVLVTGYFCYVTFLKEKTISGQFVTTEDVQYQSFDFKSKDLVTVNDIYTGSSFSSKYVIEGDMIKLYDQQNSILLLIRDDNTLIGEGFTRGTFTKK